jgi:hypothetical protein
VAGNARRPLVAFFQIRTHIAMSRVNACGLKAVLGHVFVNPSPATGNITMLMITTDGRTLSSQRCQQQNSRQGSRYVLRDPKSV